jgi:hypothetical protein
MDRRFPVEVFMNQASSSSKKMHATSKPRTKKTFISPGQEGKNVSDAGLRLRAEKKMALRPKGKVLTEIDAKKLVHELQVHQIELEMQNDEMVHSQDQMLRDSKELLQNNDDLTRFNHAAVDRELRMIELKKEVNELCKKHAEPNRYNMGYLEGH